MLPYLKKDRANGATTSVMRSPDGEMKQEDSQDDGLESCATDLMRAINMKDTKAIAAAIRAAFEILESAPHVEEEHLDEENQ